MLDDSKGLETLDRLLTTLDVGATAVAVCEVADGWRLALDAMQAPLIHYVLEGEGRMRTADSAVEVAPGSFVVVPPGKPHRMETRAPNGREKRALSDCLVVGDGLLKLRAGDAEASLVTTCGTISATFGESLGFFDHSSRLLHVGGKEVEPIRASFRNIMEELAHPVLGTRAITSALLKQCVVLLVRSELRGADTGWLWTLQDPQLGAVIAAILDRPAEDYSLDQLAALACMSRSTFTKRFADAFDISPMEFVARVRMQRAARLLATTKLPIKVIAASVGYASRSYFSRLFRRHFGEDPTAFRERLEGGGDSGWSPMKAIRSLLEG